MVKYKWTNEKINKWKFHPPVSRATDTNGQQRQSTKTEKNIYVCRWVYSFFLSLVWIIFLCTLSFTRFYFVWITERFCNKNTRRAHLLFMPPPWHEWVYDLSPPSRIIMIFFLPLFVFSSRLDTSYKLMPSTLQKRVFEYALFSNVKLNRRFFFLGQIHFWTMSLKNWI